MLTRFISWLTSLFRMKKYDENLIWYLGYGSNLNKERFLYYILGGAPDGHADPYLGCRDKTLPREEKHMIISHELYFAESAPRWEDGGVAFINITPLDGVQTFGKMYLITKQQLEDIAKQETNSNYYPVINFDEAMQIGSTIFKNPSWYGKVLYFGQNSNYPVFALTSNRLRNFTRPSPRYLSTIAKGLRDTFGLSNKEIIKYLSSKSGIANNYMIEELSRVVTS